MNGNEITPAPNEGESPFTVRFETGNFFPGFGRLNVLASIRRDVSASVPVIILTGEDGCGKSAMVKMLVSETIPGRIPVYFTKTVESFEDVVCAVAGKVDVEVPDVTRAGIAEALEKIAASIERRGDKLLLICDGAERIYLASLERIRQMLDRLNAVGVCMQVVLVGRPPLLDNLRQLRVCNFEQVPEKRYVIEPLTLSETTSYLEFCRKRIPEADNGRFTPEVVERIFQASAGNLRRINYLAGEVRNRNSNDASFWVLLENVEGITTKAGWRRQPRWLPVLNLQRFPRRALIIGAGAAVVGLLMPALSAGGNKHQPALDESVTGDTHLAVQNDQPELPTGQREQSAGGTDEPDNSIRSREQDGPFPASTELAASQKIMVMSSPQKSSEDGSGTESSSGSSNFQTEAENVLVEEVTEELGRNPSEDRPPLQDDPENLSVSEAVIAEEFTCSTTNTIR